MSRRYHLDDLIRLRDSPLVCKPTSLPPQEEWMGTSQDVVARRTSAVRGKPDDTILQGEGFGKRPSLLDHQRKSGTASTELFLGPRKFGRKSMVLDEGDDSTKSKDVSSNHEQSKPAEESRERFGDRRGLGGRPEGLNGRFSQRSDGDGFQNGRFQRKDQRDETEPRTRQEVDELRERPRWRARNGQEDISAFDEDKDGVGENGRAGQRKDFPARTRFEQPWFRNDKASDSPGERRGDSRQQEWRKDYNNRDWDRSARPEADPEWMDGGDVDDPAQAHTQEDFQRWKERMKAGGTPAEEKPSKAATDSVAPAEIKKVVTAPATLIPSDEMDKFFAKFNETNTDQDQKPQAKGPTKTRFAALWNAPSDPAPPAAVPALAPLAPLALPQPPPQPQATQPQPQPQPQTPSQADADQAGFARILQMLGSRSQNTTPQEPTPQKVKVAQPLRSEPVESQDRMKSPESNPLMAEFDQHSRNRNARKQESMGLERPIDSRSPVDGVHLRHESGSNKETSELLLNLMRQANLGAQAQANQSHSHESRQQPAYGLTAENLNRAVTARNNQTSANIPREQPMPQRRETQSSFFDEPLMHSMSYPDEQSIQEFQHNGLRRRPTNGPPPLSFFEDQYMPTRQTTQPQANPLSAIHMQGGVLPPGLHRPPGLDQMQRPLHGWPSQQPPPQQAPQQQQPPRQAPPPGIPSLPRGMTLPFGNTNPNMQIAQHLQQQLPPPPQPQGMQRPQRKYTGDSGQGFPLLGGMAPPPGFMNAGPPPGFQGGPQSYGRFQVGNEQPQGMPRNVAEMYERERERSQLRGGPGPAGNGLPPAYR